jgi:hypothetical protein
MPFGKLMAMNLHVGVQIRLLSTRSLSRHWPQVRHHPAVCTLRQAVYRKQALILQLMTRHFIDWDILYTDENKI